MPRRLSDMSYDEAKTLRNTAFTNAVESTLEDIARACNRLPREHEATLAPFFDQIFLSTLNARRVSGFHPRAILARVLGCRPWDFVINCRLEVAFRLFRDTDFEIYAIALESFKGA